MQGESKVRKDANKLAAQHVTCILPLTEGEKQRKPHVGEGRALPAPLTPAAALKSYKLVWPHGRSSQCLGHVDWVSPPNLIGGLLIIDNYMHLLLISNRLLSACHW